MKLGPDEVEIRTSAADKRWRLAWGSPLCPWGLFRRPR
jgi:hypothetical protein